MQFITTGVQFYVGHIYVTETNFMENIIRKYELSSLPAIDVNVCSYCFTSFRAFASRKLYNFRSQCFSFICIHFSCFFNITLRGVSRLEKYFFNIHYRFVKVNGMINSLSYHTDLFFKLPDWIFPSCLLIQSFAFFIRTTAANDFAARGCFQPDRNFRPSCIASKEGSRCLRARQWPLGRHSGAPHLWTSSRIDLGRYCRKLARGLLSSARKTMKEKLHLRDFVGGSVPFSRDTLKVM